MQAGGARYIVAILSLTIHGVNNHKVQMLTTSGMFVRVLDAGTSEKDIAMRSFRGVC